MKILIVMLFFLVGCGQETKFVDKVPDPKGPKTPPTVICKATEIKIGGQCFGPQFGSAIFDSGFQYQGNTQTGANLNQIYQDGINAGRDITGSSREDMDFRNDLFNAFIWSNTEMQSQSLNAKFQALQLKIDELTQRVQGDR